MIHNLQLHIKCGLLTPENLRILCEIIDKYGLQGLKFPASERISLLGIRDGDEDKIAGELGGLHEASSSHTAIIVKACPGNTSCKRGQQNSFELGLKLEEEFHGRVLPAKFTIGVSGCPNQCMETCIKDLGFVGFQKGWKIMIGGNGGSNPRLSTELIGNISTDEALKIARKVVEYFSLNGKAHRRLGSIIDNLGFDEVRNGILGSEEK
ncbi:MAG: NAD(P)/FAD-dependent oxidoreductase [Candidatus Riflebacteria bacterium]|nr:NAD(P)/FAD-dependent oxidoreductase [Candidatus Riflebacteria bacterium]